jgi:hypothetical protein
VATLDSEQETDQIDEQNQAPAEALADIAAPAAPEASAGALTSANDPVALEEQRADAIVHVARTYLQHRPRTLGSAYELVIITTPERGAAASSRRSSCSCMRRICTLMAAPA